MQAAENTSMHITEITHLTHSNNNESATLDKYTFMHIKILIDHHAWLNTSKCDTQSNVQRYLVPIRQFIQNTKY